VDELLAIGEFSARSGLSAKMLRSYAAAGLLVPAAVDPWTGYRYYAPSQLTAQADEAEIAGVLSAFAGPDQAAAELTESGACDRKPGGASLNLVCDLGIVRLFGSAVLAPG
jgi:MerR family regulatory protein